MLHVFESTFVNVPSLLPDCLERKNASLITLLNLMRCYLDDSRSDILSNFNAEAAVAEFSMTAKGHFVF